MTQPQHVHESESEEDIFEDAEETTIKGEASIQEGIPDAFPNTSSTSDCCKMHHSKMHHNIAVYLELMLVKVLSITAIALSNTSVNGGVTIIYITTV